ncbi:TPA: hypothetical protein ACPJ2V_004492 [Vibrio diabolicus]
MHTNEYNQLISDAYRTDISKKKQKEIRKKLLQYKSEVIANTGSCPKPATDAIDHLTHELSFAQTWAKWSSPTKYSVYSMAGSISGILTIILAVMPTLNSGTNEITSKIDELDKIQQSLHTLDNYIESQKNTIEAIAKQKSALELESERIQKIIEMDQVKLQAFLEYQKITDQKQVWVERFISFLIGVLSSSAVVFLTSLSQKRSNRELEKQT